MKGSQLRLRPTWAEIDLFALRQNFDWLKRQARGCFFCPMVKANAYGHGVLGIAPQLRSWGVDALGVALVEEALELRLSGDAGAILCFAPMDIEAIDVAILHSLTPCISSLRELRIWAERCATKKRLQHFPIHLEFNTGMNRLGLEPEEAEPALEILKKTNWLKLQAICSHLSQAEDSLKANGESSRQALIFAGLAKKFSQLGVRPHFYNSAAVLSMADNIEVGPEFEKSGLRPGIALYGIESENPKTSEKYLRPVMSLKTRIVEVHRLATGKSVSYGGTWKASRPSMIGVVPVGYADGFARQFSNVGKALVFGQKATVAGVVCMDYTMFDLTDIESDGKDFLNTEVILLGQQKNQRIRAQDWASQLGTITYEIFTGLGARVPRVFLGLSNDEAS